jgi:DNA-binding XRE family transcriptional regulator
MNCALPWIDQATLAECADVSRKAVIANEGDEGKSMDYRRFEVLQKLRKVFEDQFGIEFFPESKKTGEGIRLKKPKRKRFAKKDTGT